MPIHITKKHTMSNFILDLLKSIFTKLTPTDLAIIIFLSIALYLLTK